jgi:hypothetical protein
MLAFAPHVRATFRHEPQIGVIGEMLVCVQTREARWIASEEPGYEADCNHSGGNEKEIPLH